MRSNKKNFVIKIVTTPYKAICKAKDFYIRTITDCANHPNYGMPAMSYRNPLSRTTSTASSTAAEDLRELIRANSTARLGDVNITRADLGIYIKEQLMLPQSSPAIVCRRVTKSVSVGMGKIDEDAPVSVFAGDGDLSRNSEGEEWSFDVT